MPESNEYNWLILLFANVLQPDHYMMHKKYTLYLKHDVIYSANMMTIYLQFPVPWHRPRRPFGLDEYQF